MTRRLAFTAVAAAVLAAAALAAGTLGSFRADPVIPTARVERGAFERRVSADGILRAAESTPLAVPTEAEGRLRIAWLAPEGTYLEAGDVAVRFDPTELERTVLDRRADLAANARRLDKHAAETASRLENLERDAEIARRELEHSREFASRDELIFSRVEIVESRLDRELAEERLEKALRAREREAALAAADRELLVIQRRKLTAELERAERTLDALAVRAPHEGFLIYQRNWRGEPPRVGDTVFRGHPLAEIPRLGEMEVQAFVLEADAGGMAEGKPARVHLEPHPGAVYDARVASVEAVAKPRHRASPVQYFATTLELAETDPELMKPGLRVRVEILLEELAEVLTVPRQAVFERDGVKVVYRRDEGGFASVEVETGSTGLGRVVVEGPLQEGDVVALRDPQAPNAGAPGGTGEEAAQSPSGPGAALPAGGAP
ncbi:MAG: efflux RND transporter periplasmic adaptor subunit [Thermoanaerobaculia bacterium]